MKTSGEGLTLIIAREGEKLTAYKDIKGIWTVGVGHTSAAGPPEVIPNMSISPAQSRIILATDLGKVEAQVDAAVTVPISQNEFDALVSVFLNVGPAFAKSTAIKLLNKGERTAAAEAFLNWCKPAALAPRRRAEMLQFKGEAFKARA